MFHYPSPVFTKAVAIDRLGDVSLMARATCSAVVGGQECEMARQRGGMIQARVSFGNKAEIPRILEELAGIMLCGSGTLQHHGKENYIISSV